MPLYGHELDESIDPFQAGLGFAVNLADRQFPGCEALRQRKTDATRRRRVGLSVDGRRPAREGYRVLSEDGREVGVVTSGTLSPTLQRLVAMAYVEPQLATVGTRLQVDVRGQQVGAEVVKLPFYVRSP
jgi:aminomethyltransferase